MQSRTTPLVLGVAARLRRGVETHKKQAGMAAAAAAGYVMANAGLFAVTSPFGVAFAATLRPPYAVLAALGAILGYTLSSGPLSNMKYLAALVIVVGLKWLFGGRVRAKYLTLSAALTALAALGIAGTALFFAADSTLYDLLTLIAEVFLGSGAAYFFTRSLRSMESGWSALGKADVSCLIVSLAVIVMGFDRIGIGALSAGRILAALIILLAARAGAESGGAVAGITAGIALGLSSGEYAYAIAAYGFGGLAAGVFSGLGRAAAAGAFLVSGAIAALYTKSGGEVYAVLIEIFLASAIFLLLPQSAVASLRRTGFGRLAESDASAQAALRGRLEEVSGALLDVSDTTRLVGERLGRMEPDRLGDGGLSARMPGQACSRCGMKAACWQFDETGTKKALGEAAAILRREGVLSRERLPRHFAKTCARPEEFIAELNAQFQANLARENVRRKVSRVREAVSEQFAGMALMLREMTAELCAVTMLEPDKARKVREYFEKNGLAVAHTRCYKDAFDHITVEISFPEYQRQRLKGPEAAAELSVLLDAEFDLPYLAAHREDVTAFFTERAAFLVETGACQLAPEGNRLCGDVYESIPNRGGKAHFILSDGMGSGGAAAVEAGMAASLLARLLTVGFTHESALMMVNCALLIKSGEESLATIDVCTLDLYTGRASFYKAGAAPSFVIRGGRAGCVESASLPAGILQGVAFEQSSITLGEGDVIVLLSDGVTATGADWLRSELESIHGGDMQRLAEKIALTARLRRGDGREDDITVLAIALRK